MKTFLSFLLGSVFATAVEADQIVHRAKVLEIKGEVELTPLFQINGPKHKVIKQGNWIEIEAEIEVETTDQSGFIPELEVQWFAVMMDKHKKKPVRLSGKTTFKNVNTADKKIYVSAYIEPDTIERLIGDDKPSERDVEAYAIMVSGPGIVAEGKHAAGLSKATSKKEAKWWLKWEDENLEGMIVPKSNTPFAVLWTDRYPTEKESE